MLEQYKYHTITEDVKILIQYVQEQAFDHLVVEAANRLNKAIKKGVDVGLAAIRINESRDLFEKEKKQYAEDCKNHERPWELWEHSGIMFEWERLGNHPEWVQGLKYRRKPSAFTPESYSGLNWKDAEGLIGKVIEYTNNPDSVWHVGTLKIISALDVKARFGVIPGESVEYYTYIRTVEEILVPEHPTINIGGTELPKPETVAPVLGTKYWVSPACTEVYWYGYHHNKSELKEGRVHLTEERAKAWADWWNKEVLAKIKEIAS